MIVLSVRRSLGRIEGFTLSGHAEHGEHGSDIVCAGVSALAIAAVNGLEAHAKVTGVVVQSDGRLEWTMVDCESPEGLVRADAILNTMISGIRAIAESYPENVVVIND